MNIHEQMQHHQQEYIAIGDWLAKKYGLKVTYSGIENNKELLSKHCYGTEHNDYLHRLVADFTINDNIFVDYKSAKEVNLDTKNISIEAKEFIYQYKKDNPFILYEDKIEGNWFVLNLKTVPYKNAISVYLPERTINNMELYKQVENANMWSEANFEIDTIKKHNVKDNTYVVNKDNSGLPYILIDIDDTNRIKLLDFINLIKGDNN